jgi:hypothetical protein
MHPRSSPLAEISAGVDRAAPIERDQACTYVAMERGMGPIAHAGDKAMLERIDPAIFDVARVIGFVADQVLPEAALPDAALVARDANGTASLQLRQTLREAALDQPPTGREVAIAWRQLQDRMQVIWQDDECADFEVVGLSRGGDRLAQRCVLWITYGNEPMALWPCYPQKEQAMHDSRTGELIQLGYVELETVAAGLLGLEPFIESMKAQQAMLTSLSQAIQGLSDATKSAVNKAI